MAKTKINQPGDDPIIGSANDDLKHDPTMTGLKDNKQYGHYNANITTGADGVIPDIPEVEQQPINIDFTETRENSGQGITEDDDPHGFQRDPDDYAGKSEIQPDDISDDTKIEMAGVVNELLFQGLDILNDVAVKKLVINETKLRDLAIAGEIPFEVINARLQFSPTFLFDMTAFLEEQETKTRKALAFTNAEKKHIGELLEKIMKSKKFKMTPEGAIVATLVGHYGTAAYQLIMNNQEVLKMVHLISAKWEEERNIRAEAASKAAGRSTKKNASPEPKADKNNEEAVSGDQAGTSKNNDDTNPIKEFIEPGETSPSSPADSSSAKPKQTRRSLRTSDVSEAEVIIN